MSKKITNMLNKIKVRILLGTGGIATVSFLVMIGYSLGSHSVTKQTEHQIKAEARKLLVKEKEQETVLSDTLVKEFITQYFTKEKLGENNHRVKPYMTDSVYSEEVSRQEEAIKCIRIICWITDLTKQISLSIKRLMRCLITSLMCLI